MTGWNRTEFIIRNAGSQDRRVDLTKLLDQCLLVFVASG
jgi:hypothetical protein